MFILLCLVFLIGFAEAELYEDRRCTCVCPGLENNGKNVRNVYQDNHISPEQCNCEEMVLPRIESKFNGNKHTFCIQCSCRFEIRNTTLIKVVVILLCVTISVLMLYMGCLKLLQVIVKRRQNVPYYSENDKELDVLLDASRPHISDDED